MIFERETVWNAFPSVIDTDPGIDDFFCLALACAYSDRLDLRAVTTMGGNNHTDVTTQNALNILSLFRTDVPVARGAGPLSRGGVRRACGEVPRFQRRGGPHPAAVRQDAGALPAWDNLYEAAGPRRASSSS